jgi:hypothetical protein
LLIFDGLNNWSVHHFLEDTMPKKPHPADIAEADKIASATSFTIHLRTGPHDKTTERAETLAEAIRIADDMGTTAGGRKAMIYAVTPDHRAALVPATMIAQARRGL